MPEGRTFLSRGWDSSACHRGSMMTENLAGTQAPLSAGMLTNSYYPHLPTSSFSTCSSLSLSAQTVIIQVTDFDKHIGK